MGWYKVRDLGSYDSEDRKTKRQDASLWSRGGVEGVEVHIGDEIIPIPPDAIMCLVGDELRSVAISGLESMDGLEIMRAIRDRLDMGRGRLY